MGIYVSNSEAYVCCLLQDGMGKLRIVEKGIRVGIYGSNIEAFFCRMVWVNFVVDNGIQVGIYGLKPCNNCHTLLTHYLIL